jgi:protease YdgD
MHRLLPANAIHLLLGYIRGEYRVHKIASKYVLAPTYDAPVEGKVRPDDWVVLYVNDPFPPDIKPLTMADAIWPAGMPVKAGGYARERRYMMTADQHCRIEALSPDGRLVRHSCLIEPGDSGGPILRSGGGDEGVVVGINVAVPFVGANRAAARIEDFRGGIAVSAASIVAFLAASAPSREPQEGVH